MADYAARVRGCGDPPSRLPFGCKHDKAHTVAVQKAIHFPFLAIKNGHIDRLSSQLAAAGQISLSASPQSRYSAV